MLRKIRLIAIVLSAFLPICLMLMLTGNAEIIWHGFGVDSQGQIYIGTSKSIDVFEQGMKVDSIPIPVFRSYYFTVDNDVLLIAATRDVYTLDLQGAELTHTFDPSAHIYASLKHKRVAQSRDGATYRAHNVLLRSTVSKKNGTLVYMMPLYDFIIKVLLYLSMLAIVYLGASSALKVLGVL